MLRIIASCLLLAAAWAQAGCVESPAPIDEPADAAIDGGTDGGEPRPDAMPDVAPDAMPDVAPDAMPDVVPDVAPDAMPDVVPDVAPDAMPTPPDRDGDGIADADDPCPDVAARLPRDVDGDGAGDACDADDDGDGVLDVFDPCPWLADEPGPEACAADRDADGRPDAEDACPTVADPGDGPCPGPLRPTPWSRATTALIRDDEDMIVGTRGGALRVDSAGVALDVWTATDGLGPWVADLARDAAGAIWVAHDLGLSVIRPDGLVLRVGEDGPRPPAHAVAVAEDGVRYTDDRGVWLLTPAGAVRVGEPSLSLFVDGAGAVWRVDAQQAERLAPPAVVAAGLERIRPLHGAVAGADRDTFWLLGAIGAARLREGAVERVDVVGEPVTAVVERDGQVYLATASGVSRIDRDGRRLPRVTTAERAPPPLPSRLRALALDRDDRLWAGGDSGLYRLDGVLAGYGDRDLPCVTAFARFDGLIWFGTDDGLRVVDADRHVEPVEGLLGLDVRVLARVGEALWVGTEAGVTIYGPGQGVIETLRAGIELPDAPVSAIVDRRGEVWVATDGAGMAVGLPGAWQARNVGNGLLSDRVLALTDDGEHMWIATLLGLDRWHHARQQFEGLVRPPVMGPVWGVETGHGRVYAAAAQNVFVEAPGGLWSRLLAVVDGALYRAGTQRARAIALDEQDLWLLMDSSRRQMIGSVVRRAPDPADVEGERLWSMETLGFTSRTDRAGLWRRGDELVVAACGDAQAPGGLRIVEGRGLIGLDTTARRLPGGPDARLTRDVEGWPMVVGPGAAGSLAVAVRRGDLIPLSMPESRMDGWPTACAAAGERLWCIFSDGSWGQMFGNQQWLVDHPRSVGLRGAEVRDLALAGGVTAWLATDRGLLYLEAGDATLVTREAGGLIDDDVRAVRIHEDRLFAATSAGASVYDMDRDRWFDVAVDALPSGSVRVVYPDGNDRLWVGTDAGLAVFAADGTPLDASPGFDLLLGVRVDDVALDGAGRLYAATPDGLYVLRDDGSRRLLGVMHGLPGDARRLMVDPDGEVWVGGADGIARVELP